MLNCLAAELGLAGDLPLCNTDEHLCGMLYLALTQVYVISFFVFTFYL
jgi:hypothetical protein